MEYIVIFSMTALMIIPMLLIFLTQTNNLKQEIVNSQIDKIGNKIVDSAEEVYYMGYPAKKTIKAIFPEGIDSIDITGETLTFIMGQSGSTYEILKIANMNMTGTIKSYEGIHYIILEAKISGQVQISEKEE